MTTLSTPIDRLVIVRLDPDEDVLRALRDAVERETLRNGIILGGVGSLNRYHVHVVGKPSLPTEDVFLKGDGAFDILTLTGMVIDSRVHAHITFSNTQQAHGGHLEEGCRVLTFASVVLAQTDSVIPPAWDAVGPLAGQALS